MFQRSREQMNENEFFVPRPFKIWTVYAPIALTVIYIGGVFLWVIPSQFNMIGHFVYLGAGVALNGILVSPLYSSFYRESFSLSIPRFLKVLLFIGYIAGAILWIFPSNIILNIIGSVLCLGICPIALLLLLVLENLDDTLDMLGGFRGKITFSILIVIGIGIMVLWAFPGNIILNIIGSVLCLGIEGLFFLLSASVRPSGQSTGANTNRPPASTYYSPSYSPYNPSTSPFSSSSGSLGQYSEPYEHHYSINPEHVPLPSPLSSSSYRMSSENSSSVLQFRIMEEPLTAWNLTSILSALTSLHTKCWLIVQGRFADAIEYAQTHDARFINEAHLIIDKLTHNSPADIKLNVNTDVSAQGVAEALKTGIDAVTQAPFRREEAKLASEAHALDLQIKEQEAQSTLADKEQSRQIAARLAALDEKERQLDLAAKQLDLEARRLELQERRLDLETKRINVALETASKMIAMLQPNADQKTKEMLSRALLPDLLQLGSGKGLELPLLPSAQSDDKDSANEPS